MARATDQAKAKAPRKPKTAKASHKARASSKAKARPTPVFPFLSLPAEVRLTIYEYAFMDMNCNSHYINLTERKKKNRYRRSTTRISCPHTKKLPVNLLATSRQIYSEALPTLYSRNSFHFDSVGSMYLFLSQIGVRSRSLIMDVRLAAIADWGSARNLGHPAFAFLSECTSLKRVQFGFQPSGWWRPVYAAKKLYTAMHSWIETVGARKGDRMAAIKLVEWQGGVVDEEKSKAFQKEMERLVVKG